MLQKRGKGEKTPLTNPWPYFTPVGDGELLSRRLHLRQIDIYTTASRPPNIQTCVVSASRSLDQEYAHAAIRMRVHPPGHANCCLFAGLLKPACAEARQILPTVNGRLRYASLEFPSLLGVGGSLSTQTRRAMTLQQIGSAGKSPVV